jgi:drug/metabolite transporter (DMT)-like permease
MPQLALFAVLIAALLDALQHYMIKSGTDPFARALGVAIAGGLIAAPALAVTGLPASAALPVLALSVMLGTLYWLTLGWAYQSGALAMVFPLSRGGGVILTALGGNLILGERLTTGQTFMLCLMVLGIYLVACAMRPKGQNLGRSDLVPTLFLTLIIAAFTLVDAVGVRLSGSALAYTLVLYLGNGLAVGLVALLRHSDRLARLPRGAWPGIALSALLSLISCALVLYGMLHGPVAVVAALAETSILFAAFLGILWLREPTTAGHSLGLTAIVIGVVLLRLDFWPAT